MILGGNVYLLSHFRFRKQYPPISLLQLQRLIDLGRIDVTEPIDLTTLCNTKIVNVDPHLKHYGVNLTDEVHINIIFDMY